MHPLPRIFAVAFVLACVSVPISQAAPGDKAGSGAVSAATPFSAGDFDWRNLVPYLDQAAGLSDEDGLKLLLEHSAVLRAYIGRELDAQCRSDARTCAATAGDLGRRQDITQSIDDIVHRELYRQGNVTRVDYPLPHQPFPFTFIAALKTRKHRDAYLVLYFAEHSYTAVQLRAKLGDPTDSSVFWGSSFCHYKLKTSTYKAKATYTIDPVNGEVSQLVISLRESGPRKP